MKKYLLLLSLLLVNNIWGQVTIFSENMGTPTGTTTIVANTFQNSSTLTYSNGAQTSSADVRSTSVSSTYPGFSASGNVFFTTTSGAYGFSIEGINASSYNTLTLDYGYRKESATLHATFSVDYWNGTAWVNIANTSSTLFNQTTTAAAGWYSAKQLALPVGAQISGLKIRFVKTGTASIRIDDVVLKGLSATPTITTSPSLTAFTTTYGTPSTAQMISVSGSNLTNDIIATAPAGFEISDGGSFGSTVNFTQSGGTASGTLSIRLAGTAVAAGNYNSNSISLTSTGATTVNLTTPSSGNSVSPKSLSVTSGLSVSNKQYDGNTSASITGTPVFSGIVNGDALGLTPSGNFADKVVGTGKSVTSTSTLTGTNASSYTLTQPSSLTADITAKNLTVTGASANNKVFDGFADAIISGVLSGVVSGDNVTFIGTGTFFSTSIGTGINVTSTSTLGGTDAGNYTLTQPTGLTADITAPSPTISVNSTTATPFTTTYGTNSTAQQYTVTGQYLSNDITVTAPTGFEISPDGTTYSSTFDFSSSAGSVTGTLYIRLSSTAIPSGSYNSQSISLVSTGASTVNIVTTASGNSVSPKNLTITGLSVNNKVYDGNTTGNSSSSPSLVGVINSDAVNITGTPSFIFSNKLVGTAKPVTISGFSLSGANASNYNLTQPTGLTADITAKSLTITSPSVSNKVYDGTNTASLTGSLAGVIGADVVTLNLSGTFSSANAGTGLTVTSTSTITGADNANYSLTQPTGLTADITKNSQTITFTLGTAFTTATSPIALNGTSTSALAVTYSSSNTAVATISGSTLTIVGAGTADITASQAGDGNYNAATDVVNTITVTIAPSLTEIILPQYIQGVASTNNNRVPFAFRVKLSNLIANSTYKYFTTAELASAPTGTGAGNFIAVGANQSSPFTALTGSITFPVSGFSTFITDNNGEFTGWFILSPTANATRFVPGAILNAHIMLNDGAGGSSLIHNLKTINTFKVVNLTTGSTANDGTGLYGLSNAVAKNFVFVYDNVAGSGRPISGTFVESDGATVLTSFATFYKNNVDAVNGAYGLIIPNQNSNGIRRIEQRSFLDGSILGCPATDADGTWPSGANTVNPTGGTTAIAITSSDAAFGTIKSNPSTVTALTAQCTDDNGWSYYGTSADLYFAIKKGTSGLTGDTVDIEVLSTNPSSTSTLGTNKEHGSFLMKHSWNVTGTIPSGQSVDIRFFYNPADTASVIADRDAALTAVGTSNPSTQATPTPFHWFKTVGVPYNSTWQASIVGNIFPTTHIKLSPNYGVLNTINNYVDFNGITSFSGGTGGAGFGPQSGGSIGLPVTWAGFEVSINENGNVLNWKTASEHNTSHFEVEYSYDGKNFTTVNSKINAAGNSSILSSYNYTHADFARIIYYRIKQIDNDNRFSHSEIKSVKRTSVSTPTVSVYPMPLKSDNILKLKISSIDLSEINLKMINLTGKVVYSNSILPKSDLINETIDLSNLPSGIYFLEIKNGQFKTVKKLFK